MDKNQLKEKQQLQQAQNLQTALQAKADQRSKDLADEISAAIKAGFDRMVTMQGASNTRTIRTDTDVSGEIKTVTEITKPVSVELMNQAKAVEMTLEGFRNRGDWRKGSRYQQGPLVLSW